MIIRDLIIKEHRVLTEAQARAQLMEDPVFRQARQFGQLLVEYQLTKDQVQQLFKDVEQGATAAGSNRTGLGKAKDFTGKAIGSVQNMLASAKKWVKARPTYAAVDAEYNKAMTALGKAGGENGEANAITKAIYKYRDAAKNYPRATGLAKWAIITAAGLATGGVGGAGVAAGLAAIDSALKDKEIVDIVGDAAAAALVSGAVQGASDLGGQALDAYRGLPSDAAVAANNAALGGFNDSGVPGGAASNINGLDLPADTAAATPNIVGPGVEGLSPEEISKLAAQAKAYGIDGDVTLDQLNKAIMQTAEPGTVPADYSQIGAGAGGSTYTVTADDFKGLGKIAQDNGLTAQQLWDANPQITDPNKIFIGQEINIPAASGEPVKNIWQGWEGPTKASAPAVEPGPGDNVPTLTFSNPNGPQPIPATGGQIGAPFNAGIAPIGPNGQPMRLVPMDDGPTNLTPAFDPNKLPDGYTMKKGPTPVQESVWSKVAESVKVKVLPNNQLIDSKFTVYAWALNESTNRDMGRSLQLTKLGVRTVFENIGRYRSAYLKEDASGMAPGAPVNNTAVPGKPKGWFGQSLDTIGRGVDKVGKWASNFGHNVITKVTADKLTNMWNRADQPYDSDRLYQLLTTEWGVPKEVVDSVYQRMNLSAAPAATTAPSATPTGTTTPTSTGGTVTQTPTGQVHRARANNPNAAPANPATAVPTTAAAVNPDVAKNYAASVARTPYATTPAARTKKPMGPKRTTVGTRTSTDTAPVPAGSGAAGKIPGYTGPNPTVEPTSMLGNYVDNQNTHSTNRADIANNLKKLPADQLESLSWSRNFNPGMTLFRQMKREQL